MVGKRLLRLEHDLNLRINLGKVSSQNAKRREVMNTKNVLLRRKIGLVGAVDLLQVRNITTGFDHDEFPPPYQAGSSFDGQIDVAIPVPVTSHKVHVGTDDNPAVVDFDGRVGEIELFLNADIARLRECFVIGDERVQSDGLLAMAQGLEVVGFDNSPSLSLCEHPGGQRRTLKSAPCFRLEFCG